MSLVKIRGKVDASGVLTAQLPPHLRNGESVDIFVETPADHATGNLSTPFEKRRQAVRALYGSIDDDTFVRPGQGEFETRETL
jgi:hypothetical protein